MSNKSTTLLIGLGGTGKSTARQIYESLLRTQEPQHPIICIDDDSPDADDDSSAE